MAIFSAASPHDIFILLLQVGVLLLVARVCGHAAQYYGQPAVVGELLGGILIGPSVLGALFPITKTLLIPQTPVQGYLLELVSLFGALFLLLITGMETDLRLIKRHLKTAIGMSLSGLMLTFSLSFFLGQNLPASLLVDPANSTIFALFLATAISIASIPVIAKVLMDLNLIRREVGQIILAAGMFDDTIGWVILSIVMGLSTGVGISAFAAGKIIAQVILFLVLALTVGRWLIRKIIIFMEGHGAGTGEFLSLTFVLMCAFGALTQFLHIEALFGAFILGLILGQIRQMPVGVHSQIESFTLSIFAPVFFAVVGLKINVLHLFEPTLIVVSLLVLVVASVGKIGGAYFGARVIGGKDGWTAFSLASALNARGAIGIIVATIGLNEKILSQDMFSIVVLMSVVTSVMAPVMMRWSVHHIKMDPNEMDRLAEENRVKGSVVEHIRRVLLPVRYKPGKIHELQSIEAKILGLMGQKKKLSITLFSVARSGEKEKVTAHLNSMSGIFTGQEMNVKVVESEHLADVILDEAHKNYDLMILGATELDERTDILFTPLVDYLVRAAPCPTLVVKGVALSEHRDMTRILLPSSGSGASRHSAELAFQIAGDKRYVTALHVVVQGDGNWAYGNQDNHQQREHEISREITLEAAKLGQKLGVSTDAVSLAGKNPEEVILNYAHQNHIDLIVLGTNLRPGSDKLFLGPRVERILNNTPCPVLVFNTM